MCFAYGCEDAVPASAAKCIHFRGYSFVHFHQGVSESLSFSHTHQHTHKHRQRSPIRRGITCHGECLSGRELESVARESAGISPLAAQHSRQQHKPGQAQKVGQPKTHTHMGKCRYTRTLFRRMQPQCHSVGVFKRETERACTEKERMPGWWFVCLRDRVW